MATHAETVLEPLLRMAISALQNANTKIDAIHVAATAQKHAQKLDSAEKRISEAIEYLEGWAKANRVELRTNMLT